MPKKLKMKNENETAEDLEEIPFHFTSLHKRGVHFINLGWGDVPSGRVSIFTIYWHKRHRLFWHKERYRFSRFGMKYAARYPVSKN